MIREILVRLARLQKIHVALDQSASAAQQERDLSDLHILAYELGATNKRREIIRHRLRRVTHDLADLCGRLSFERQPNDLNPMRKHGTDVVDRAAQGNRRRSVLRTQQGQVA